MHTHHGKRMAKLAIGIGLPVAMLLAAGAVAFGVPRLAPVHAQPGSGPRTDLKNFQHVFVIMMENTGYHALIGNPNAPWINDAAARYGLAKNSFGVTHPSQPNYIAATSGDLHGITDDNDHTIDVPNIVDQLESHGKTWKAYMQSYALCVTPTDSACGQSLYERKHNPFISYTDVQDNSARVAKIVDLSQLDTDLANNTVPDYVWISPDQCHDMHGRAPLDKDDLCGYTHEQNLIAMGDTFLRDTVGKIMASPAWNGNSVIFVTWDESDYTGSGPAGFGDTHGCCDSPLDEHGHLNGGGHIVTLVISHSDHTARTSDVPYNHYSMLATIQDGWGLGCLANTCDTANVPPMSDLVGPKG